MKISGSMALVVVLVAVLSACGSDKIDKPATQMAARVNGDEITVHQVSAVLSRATGISPANIAQAKQEILDRLIDQQLAVQKAEEGKLDRTPAVVQALDAARREILARAYLEQLAAAQPKPTAEEARSYFAGHPELFAQRRIYSLQEMQVPADGMLSAEIKGWVAQGKGMQEMADMLKARNIAFTANVAVRPAEQMPLESLPRFHALKDGETIVIQNPAGLNVVHLVSSQSSPVDEATALPRVEQFLALRKNSEVAAAEVKALREKAKIDRMGEFAPDGATPATPMVNLEKGVAGLK